MTVAAGCGNEPKSPQKPAVSPQIGKGVESCTTIPPVNIEKKAQLMSLPLKVI